MKFITDVTPTNFREVDIYPTEEEILGTCKFVRKNIIDGRFENVDQYLDIQFRLLREDFVANLREAVESYRCNEPSKGLEIYTNVKLFKSKTKWNEECVKIEISSQNDGTKKFMNGSLLLFTQNNFGKIFLGKVTQRLKESGEVIISLINVDNQAFYLGVPFTMAECSQYFDPYYQVLNAFKNISRSDFPMEKYIVNVDTSSVYMPKYLIYSGLKYQIGGYRFPPEELPNIQTNLLGLNNAQFQAFKAALTQEFVVIQGPPGTGKTHLGVKISETLIKNSHFWYKNTPMLIISHKNDALDQFLEGLIPITDKLVRVGGQSKSDKLKAYNLTNDKCGGDGFKRRAKENYLSTMQKALVVGMTTSIAARWKDYLERLKSPIVIVEEAAEVLEAHVVAALTNSCQHLILIGDHQQLQPLSADHNISQNYHLGISLFERMVRNKIQWYQLNIQHRMRPEISVLLKSKIYPRLIDDDSVKERPSIRGVDKNVYFINHKHPEESSSYTTKKNSFEARFLISFARYLVLNGYAPNEIVILATYAGQFQELETLIQKETYVKDVKISTLDGFQGQESDIVLLSLVRSDSIGFLAKENRVCVALSRARNGLYVMGNMALLSNRSKLWYCVKQCLEHQKAIGEQLPLRCQVHEKITKVESLDDFWMVQNGGCSKKCECLLSCGHVCCLLCHNECLPHKCENGCVQQSNVEQGNQVKYPNLWRSPRHDFQQGTVVQEERSFVDLIFAILKNAVTGLVQFFIDMF